MPRPGLRGKTKKKNAVLLRRCAICKEPLHGTKTASKSTIKRFSKTEKRPERPYGGNVCHRCLREKIKATVRATQE